MLLGRKDSALEPPQVGHPVPFRLLVSTALADSTSFVFSLFHLCSRRQGTKMVCALQNFSRAFCVFSLFCKITD